MLKPRPNLSSKYILNHQIRASEVRLIGADGSQVGVVRIDDALRQAETDGLDLLLVSPEAKPPVCKIVDFGQYRYEQQKKEKNAKKGSRGNVIKELKLSPKISEHDYQVRVTNGKKFLEKGYKVKATVVFKGREITHPELGRGVMERYIEDLKELGQAESSVVQAGRTLTMVIGPKA